MSKPLVVGVPYTIHVQVCTHACLHRHIDPSGARRIGARPAWGRHARNQTWLESAREGSTKAGGSRWFAGRQQERTKSASFSRLHSCMQVCMAGGRRWMAMQMVSVRSKRQRRRAHVPHLQPGSQGGCGQRSLLQRLGHPPCIWHNSSGSEESGALCTCERARTDTHACLRTRTQARALTHLRFDCPAATRDGRCWAALQYIPIGAALQATSGACARAHKQMHARTRPYKPTPGRTRMQTNTRSILAI